MTITQTTKSSPGRPRSIEVHQAILQATLDLLAEFGYQGLSIEAIAARAGVGKATIYRRYNSKEELIAEAIECNRPQLTIPDTGSLWTDLEEVHKQAAELDLSPLGRQTIAMIISLASTIPQFAEIYWKKYVIPRRKAASIIFKRAKARGEMSPDVDPDLICDLMTGLLFKSILFQPETEEIKSYMRRALDFLLQGVTSKPSQ
ncbi:TetR/AcrR family transcriptional regulator [Chroogloeocystis siderophila]|uniref:TetR/AcrR family transcriptional regulator n=1 Tax=Chroogloeocystis siderophila TaxID=329163 RepID=UPI0011614CDE|nr:TetR/AcrR family transcriptional regulator [Chroogloeocystis siderophila]